MHAVITIKRRTDDTLVCGQRVAERLAGAVLAVLASSIGVAAGIRFYQGLPYTSIVLVLAACLFLLSLHVALSNRHFTFGRRSQTCLAQINVIGIFRQKRTFNFRQVQCRRQFDYQRLRWLYILVLIGPQNAKRRSLTMGYAASPARGEAMARAIAEFTETVALDPHGHEYAPREGADKRHN